MTNQIEQKTSNDLLHTIKSNPLYPVIDAYVRSVKTKNGATPSEEVINNFILTCVSYGLNPIKKQAYLIGYDKKSGASFTEVVAISGFTLIATKTGKYAGVDAAQFTYDNKGRLDTCNVTVYRIVEGIRCGFTATAYYSERVQMKDVYVNNQKTGEQAPNEIWSKQPKTMLQKCATAAALRLAFPDELSGIYAPEEIEEDKETRATPATVVDNNVAKPTVTPMTEKQTEMMASLIDQINQATGKTHEEIKEWLAERFDRNDRTSANASKIINFLLAEIEQLKKKPVEEKVIDVTKE